MKMIEWIKIKKYGISIAALILLLLMIGIDNGNKEKLLDRIVLDELSGLASASHRVVLVTEGRQKNFGYEEIARDFSYSVRTDLRVLDHLADRSGPYQNYDFPELENFCLKIVEEYDVEQQQRNIDALCEIAQELEGIEGKLKLPLDIIQRIERIEVICKNAY